MFSKATNHIHLPADFPGEIIRPGDKNYDQARAVWNGMIDKHPLLIVRPAEVTGVIHAVNAAREAGLALAVRCGGHSVSGLGTCDDGILVDLSLMKGVRVDPERQTAWVKGGSLWEEVDRETQRFGLATPGGRAGSTGVGGFTLGGGYGWLSSKYGLACDNLISLTVVTADGAFVRASETENSELFWGLRGGSGNFGVVTSYEFQLYPVGTELLAGVVYYPMDQARKVIRAWRDYVDDIPDEVSSAVVGMHALPGPDFPAELHGKPMLGMRVLYVGDPDEGHRWLEPFTHFGGVPLLAGGIKLMPYLEFQSLLDPYSPPGNRVYNSGTHLAALTDEAIDVLVDHSVELPALLTQTLVGRSGGAIAAQGRGDTAAGHRDAAYLVHLITIWTDPADDERNIQWCQDFTAAMRQHSTGGVYLNFAMKGEEASVQEGFDPQTWRRLIALKNTYDPHNLFRINQNIPPDGWRQDHTEKS